MQISINKKSNDSYLRGNFFKLFSSKFSNRGELESYNDNSSSSFTGATYRFIGGQLVKEEASSTSTIKITLEFEPNAGVDIYKLEDEIKQFLEQDFKLSASEYTLDGIASNTLKY
ncbi:Uncharacterised protein [Legionella beliardensis]|uniref:Uncharacterized protein n=1 Tax=Legionella beliardensis TaxID=91822 RepID=A0A378HZX9_9GAMM|nr:hypothetical protein [Legionella beliardensis]STX28293.1 Uncharacterised protein [Legionella beliardensis]